jgi:hypothetical protein
MWVSDSKDILDPGYLLSMAIKNIDGSRLQRRSNNSPRAGSKTAIVMRRTAPSH